MVPVTPVRIPTTETNAVPMNGRPPIEVAETSKPIEPPIRFSPFPLNFSSNLVYPPMYPPVDMSVPPPNVAAMSPIVPPPNLGTPNSIRHIPPPTTTTRPPPFQPFTYPPNLSYFPRTPGTPFNNQRSYYPPQL